MNMMKKLVDGFIWAFAAFAVASAVRADNVWTYSGGTVTDGGWVINCTYTVGSDSISLSTVATTASDGILDLREMSVTDGSTATPIARIDFTSNWDNGVAVKEFYADCVASLPRLFNNKTIEKVVVANPLLTSISGWAFSNAANLTSDISDIVAPGTTVIGQNAFTSSGVKGKLALTAVSSIGNSAFQSSKIEEVDISSDALTSLGSAFYQCTMLTNVTLSCPNLVSLAGTFGYCGANLKRVSLVCPALATIGDATFRNNGGLSVDIQDICPPSVTSVGAGAFQSCGGLTGRLSLPNLTSLGANAFQQCGVQEAEIGGSLETIPSSSFYYCTSLTNATLNCPNVTTIASQAFQFSGNLKQLTLTCPKLTSVAANAFTNGGSPLELSVKNGPWVVSETDYTAAILDNILVSQSAMTSAKHAVIYADKASWEGRAAALTDGEKAYAPEKAYGVYATAGDVRKAFFVQPEWAKRAGMAIFVR